MNFPVEQWLSSVLCELTDCGCLNRWYVAVWFVQGLKRDRKLSLKINFSLTNIATTDSHLKDLFVDNKTTKPNFRLARSPFPSFINQTPPRNRNKQQ